jgi:hypothetical protein
MTARFCQKCGSRQQSGDDRRIFTDERWTEQQLLLAAAHEGMHGVQEYTPGQNLSGSFRWYRTCDGYQGWAVTDSSSRGDPV